MNIGFRQKLLHKLLIFSQTRSIGDANTNVFPRQLFLHDRGYVPTLGPPEITKILRLHESSLTSNKRGSSPIKGYDSNQLNANNPMEDRRMQARLLNTDGVLFGVLDGHAGPSCAESVSQRLLDYIALALLPSSKLEDFIKRPFTLIKEHKMKCVQDCIDDISSSHRANLQKFASETLSASDWDDEDEDPVAKALISAYIRLDANIGHDGLPKDGKLDGESLAIAMSGSCGCVAHISDLDVHVANVGDTRGVLGSLAADGNWTAKILTKEHNYDNKSEVDRILSAHPKSEEKFVLRDRRLLGQLVPLRSFGDMRYKWQSNRLQEVVNLINSPAASRLIPPYYHTPPYLICTPEVGNHRLTVRDRFLVLASDGLWDMLSADKVVQIVGNFLMGKETNTNFELPADDRSLLKIVTLLKDRRARIKHRTEDENASTHLIRHALGYDHKLVSEMLALPEDVARLHRDDITVTVIFFDSDYIARKAAAEVKNA
ncbi:DgyrCDS387 [Dimorphilus gyrociliatus]|uniref:DgyrCDS387 n=1 Tax=Dimorphilus gyrociliatus TaxID=2664684 RepID=A0A7I8V768_9ANNE|nr:DgyrCDS387 [Dimorphilus gyrociliatus]